MCCEDETLKVERVVPAAGKEICRDSEQEHCVARKVSRRNMERGSEEWLGNSITICVSRNITSPFLCTITEKYQFLKNHVKETYRACGLEGGNISTSQTRRGSKNVRGIHFSIHFSLQASGHFKIRRESEKQSSASSGPLMQKTHASSKIRTTALLLLFWYLFAEW